MLETMEEDKMVRNGKDEAMVEKMMEHIATITKIWVGNTNGIGSWVNNILWMVIVYPTKDPIIIPFFVF